MTTRDPLPPTGRPDHDCIPPINRARDEITPGTFALFVLSSNAVQYRVREAFAGQDIELLFTNLSREQEEKLRAAFGE